MEFLSSINWTVVGTLACFAAIIYAAVSIDIDDD